VKTRDYDILRQEAQASDKTSKTWDLKGLDPLSALWLEFWCTNGTTSNKGNFISDIITKVEVVDGSKPLISLNMFELETLHFLKTGQSPGLFPSEHASGVQRHGCYLLFGRRLWDPDFAFSPGRYKNPQLKLSWDLGAVRTIDTTTSFATGTLGITICAKVMEDVPIPPKYLSQVQVETFTAPTSGNHKTEMVVNYPWRLLLLRNYLIGKDIDEIFDAVTIDCDSGKFKPLDKRYVRDLDSEALQTFGRSEFKHDVFTHHQIGFREINNKENSSKAHMYEDTTGYICNVQYEWSSEGKLDIIDYNGAAVGTDKKVTLKEDGHAMHAILPIPFGRLEDPNSWFDATKFGKIDLTQYVPAGGGAAAVSSVVLEQPRPNGE